jgi:hypothetical protein
MTELPARPAPAALPALDEAREKTVGALSRHFAGDRLDVAELERRLDLVYAAGSQADLDRLLADLPALAAGLQAESVPAVRVEPGRDVARTQTMVAVMGGAERKGQWTPPRHLNVLTLMGGADVDFREAIFGVPVTEVTVVAFMGGVEIIVPPGVRVESNGFALMGAFESVEQASVGPEAPLIKVNGFVCMGAAEIKVRLPGETYREAKRRLKEERRRKKLNRGDG